MQTLILASSSSYRKSLLKKTGSGAFEAVAPDIDEARLPGESPEAMVRRLSEAKARALAGQFPQHIIIGSDQVATLGDTSSQSPGTTTMPFNN
ncbi:MAG: Maf family protein [Porticoccaceae bacterium]